MKSEDTVMTTAVKPTWRLRQCPRCPGDLYREQEEYGEVYQCLQCGYLHYPGFEIIRRQVKEVK